MLQQEGNVGALLRQRGGARLLRVLSLGVLLLVGVLERAWVLSTPQGYLNADEAITGLVAKHVLHGEIPLMTPGNPYTAPLEGYLYVPVAAVLGYHALPLKLIVWVTWALAGWLTYLAARRIGVRQAWVAGAMVWLAPGMLMVLATKAYLGYGSGMAFVAAALWAVAHLMSDDERRWRWAALFGFACAVAFYLHPVYLMAAVPMAIPPALRLLTHVREWWLPVIAGSVIGLGPMIFWNLRHDWRSLQSNPSPETPYLDRLQGIYTEMLPRGLGARTFSGEWVFGPVVGTALVVLVCGAGAMGAALLVHRRKPDRWTGLLVLLPLLITPALMAVLPNMFYTLDARYLVALLPFLAVGLATVIGRLGPALAVAGMALWVAVLTAPLLVAEVGTDVVDPNAEVVELVERIHEAGLDKVSGSYWLVHPIEYLSDGQITAAVSGHPPVERFPDNERTVDASPATQVAMVFTPDQDLPENLLLAANAYERVELRGAVLYLPQRGR